MESKKRESKEDAEDAAGGQSSIFGKLRKGRNNNNNNNNNNRGSASSLAGSSTEGKTVSECEEDDDPTQIQYKVILLGDGSVGKTSTATRFTQDHFRKSYKQTIGLDFFIKRLILPGEVHVAMQLWDIGGQSIGSKMLGNYIFGAEAIILMYDVTNFQSFQDLEDWMRLVRKVYTGAKLPYMALVANKCDLEHLRTVTSDKHNDFADENDFYSYFVSAKSGDNVKAAFHRIAADLAGITLSGPELQVAHQVVKAEIVEHQKDDPSVEAPSLRQGAPKAQCTIS